MPDLEQNNQSDFPNENKEFLNENKEFLIEKIKEKPVNKKKLIRRTIITVSMAVIFGSVACVTFLVLEPVISNWLYPEEEPEIQTVEFPEDKEEMSPEDMLAENLPTESPEPTPSPSPEPDQAGEGGEEEYVQLGQEQVQEILSQVTFDLNHYSQLYAALYEYGNELSRHIVTVTAVTSNIDWFNSVQESENQCSGVIISENGMGAIDNNSEDGRIHDDYRTDYMRAHVEQMREAIADGVDVFGYAWWGPIDLVSSGTSEMTKRYGMIYVDQDDYNNGTHKRSKKKSFYYYKKLIASNGADLENNVTFEE